MFFYSERKNAVHHGAGKVWWQNPETPLHSALSAVGKHIMLKKRHWSAKHQGPTRVTHFPQQGCKPKDVTAFLHRITNLGPSAQTSVCRGHCTFKQHLVSSFQKVLLTNNDQEERS